MASNLESSSGDIAGTVGADVFPNGHEADILKLDNGSEVSEAEMIMEVQKETNNEPEEYEEIELSPEGILDEETIARGLSNIGSSANGIHQVYLNVSIPGFSLINIDALSGYRHLQKVEIPHNNITDLSALGKLKHLLILNASHNKIEKLLDFEPPTNLKEVNLAWNNITEMSDLSAHHFLHKLILDNNNITIISGLQNCKRLKHLSLVHNKIAMIQGLYNLPIQHLNLSHNKLRTLNNLETLSYLRELKLMGNCIRSLSGLDNNTMLESLDLEANEVIDVLEMDHIKHIKSLHSLNLLRNPIQELPDYRLYILFKLNRLVVLDRHMIAEQEKVTAINVFQSPDEVIAFQDHMTNVVYAFLQPMKVWNSTLPSIETPYPMLVLVGPQGSGKKDLARKLVDEFGDYFGYGISHTTKHPRLDEVAERDYHFVSLEQFVMDVKRGKFVQTCQFKDEWFGLQMETIEDVAKEGLACVVHMELEGVLTLKKTHFEPRYILIMPLDHEAHELRLRERHIYTEADIKKIQKKTEMYIQHNQEHPGFFDMMICSDNITEAYIQLRKLVMDYLGISSITSASTVDPIAVSEAHEVEPVQSTTERVPSNVMRANSWSRPTISESFSQGSGRGFVEEESIKRRYSAAKDIVTGYVPPLTEQLQIKYPDSAPQVSKRKSDSKEKSTQKADSVASSHCGHDEKCEVSELPVSPDSSSRTSSFSSVSDPLSATELSRVSRAKFNRNMNFQDTLPTEKVNTLLLIDEPGYHTTSGAHTPNIPITLPDSKNALSRPGSNRHAVLPPIQNSVA